MAAFGLHGVVGQAQKLAVAHAGDFDRVLKGQEEAGTGAHFRRHLKQISAFEQHLACRDLIRRVTRQHLGKGALARAVGPHDGVNFTGLDSEVEAFEYLDAVDGGAQAAHLQQCLAILNNHPTLPSSLSPSNLVASTANSIGSWRNTSLQKPLMIIETASSAPMPRCAK